MRTRFQLRPRGMTLLEVILALALFTTAAVGLVIAINSIGEAILEARALRTVEQTLEGIIDEESKKPQIVELDKEIKPGADGIAYHVRVVPETKVLNQAGMQLNGLFRITVTAKWKMDGYPMTLQAETLRYAGMFMPAQ